MTQALSRRVRGLVNATSHARDVRSRRPPALRAASRDEGRNPIVYFLTPDQSVARGGVRTNYRQVDLLNAAGIEAAVVHGQPRFRCTWFANETRVVSAPDVELGPQDILVVP